METLKLKNGSEETTDIVTTLMMALRHLLDKKPIPFYELVMCCRDRSHQPVGNTGDVLSDFGLWNDGVHESVRNVVLSAVEGDGWEIRLTSPI